jgi:hypothetical protein
MSQPSARKRVVFSCLILLVDDKPRRDAQKTVLKVQKSMNSEVSRERLEYAMRNYTIGIVIDGPEPGSTVLREGNSDKSRALTDVLP